MNNLRSSSIRKYIRHACLGQGMTEYIIIVALIAVAAIGVFAAFGNTAKSQVGAMARELAGQDGTALVNRATNQANQAQTAAQKSTNLGNYGNQKQYAQ